jgi:hypothetical protein
MQKRTSTFAERFHAVFKPKVLIMIIGLLSGIIAARILFP